MSSAATDLRPIGETHRDGLVGAVSELVRTVTAVLVYLALGFAAAVALSVTLPSVLGFPTFDVLSGSMTPTLRVGDVVVERSIRPGHARIGDIVSFRSPDGGRLITHRIVSLTISGRSVSVVTQGDANTGVERWSIAADGRIGKVIYRIPKLGYVTNRAGSGVGRIALVVVPALLLGFFELRRIWARPDGEDDA